MFKLSKNYLLKPNNSFLEEKDGVLIYTFPSMPEAIVVQIEKTSKEYFRAIVWANNRFYYLRIRYKLNVEYFLKDIAQLEKSKKNIVFVMDYYNSKAA